MRTALCQRLGIDFPIIQAAIGGAAGPALASAVCRAGGLGTLGLSAFDGEETRARIRQVRRATDRPFVGNVVLAYDVAAQIDAMLSERIPIVSIFWGDPAPLAGRVHEAGALLMVTVGSVDEARRAVAAGADFVVAQGWEAGGHVRGTTSTLALVPAVVDAVAPVPVVAAGGIADGRGLAAVLALGAQAAWIGTRFLGATEADLHPVYRDRVLAASADDTVYSLLFDGGWPDAPGRALRNATVAAWEAAGRPAPGRRPGEGEAIGRVGSDAVFRYEAVTARSDFAGGIEAMSLWAGQGVGLVRRSQPAGEIVRDLVQEAHSVMRAGGRLASPTDEPEA
jgi:NAD(P)H-dependent flavin oxidoreductase YrpB (nitropropane dioxygenase family)